jgi:signal transduction histidine kinase
MSRPGSLRSRLLVGAAISIAVAVGVAGFALAGLFYDHARGRFLAELGHHLDQLAAGLEIGAGGRPELVRPLSDPRFHQPMSGLYWQVENETTDSFSSRSLWDLKLALPEDLPADGEIHEHTILGPRGESLVVLERALFLPDDPQPLRIAIAEDEQELLQAVASFNRMLALWLGILAVVLIGAALLQVQLGLKPLRRLQEDLAAVRANRAKRLLRPTPSEVQPLVDDLNVLLDHADEVVERARLQAGNLAHGLKTHLAVLMNEAQRSATGDVPADTALLQQQVGAMRRHIDYHLARARMAAARGVPGASADVGACVEALVRTMRKVHAARSLDIVVHVPCQARFSGESQDLEEMLGNLIDNACKWSRRQVTITCQAVDSHLLITIDDDGSGLAAERREQVLAPGVRLDESVPGSGLGLAVVRDLARLYGGDFCLDQSPLGGLRAKLRLPRVP